MSFLIAIWFIQSFAACADDGFWPDYRGPSGNGCATAPGVARSPGLPAMWSETVNIRWKTPIDPRGWSTPVAAGGKLWLTAAAQDGREFFGIGVDAANGRIVWRQRLFHCDSPEPLGNALNGYASPSPAVESGRVYFHFGSYGTCCVDSESRAVVWERTDLPCRHYRGPGSSVVLFDHLLLLTMDGIDVQYVAALDKQTGKTVWQTSRTAEWNDLGPNGKPKNDGDLRKSYSTPLVVRHAGKDIVLSVGAKAAYGYDPRTGKELWKVPHLCQGCGARPVYGNGMAYMPTGFGNTEIIAVRPDGAGDVSASHVAWRTVRGMPRLASPVLVGDRLYALSDVGVVTCLDAKSGDEVWKHRIGGAFASSLLYGDGKLYACNQDGQTTVFAAADKFNLLGVNRLDAGCMASPIAVGQSLVLRTKTHLYCIARDQ